MKKNWTGERLETFIYTRDAIEHLHRYAIVTAYCNNKVVLDIACGEGYGSAILSENAKRVEGVDIDAATVANAKLKYKKDNVNYTTGDATKIPFEDASFDVVVSFETIEHHNKHDEMMREIRRVLKPEGIVIISTPDKHYYSDVPNFKNKFHVKELYKDEFVKLITNYFPQNQLLTQRYYDGISIIQDADAKATLPVFAGDYSSVYSKDVNPLYLIAIATNAKTLEPQHVSVFEGSRIIEKQAADLVYNSNSFKLGSWLLSPFKFLKSKM